MTNPTYKIQIRGDVLCANMHKETRLDVDLQYLLDFAVAAQSLRNRPWGILSDMRDWNANAVKLKNRSILEDFDRRNQIAECWVVRDDEQAKALIPIIQAHATIKFARVKTFEEARTWYKKQPLFFDDDSPWDDFLDKE